MTSAKGRISKLMVVNSPNNSIPGNISKIASGQIKRCPPALFGLPPEFFGLPPELFEQPPAFFGLPLVLMAIQHSFFVKPLPLIV